MNAWKRSLAALCAAQFLAMLAMSQFLPFLTLYLGKLGMADASRAARWSGLLLGVGFLAAALMAPVWGSMADRWGKKGMVLRAMTGSGVAVGLMAWARGAWDLFFLRMLQGTLGGFVSSTTALVAALVPESKIGTAVGAAQSSLMAGLIVGPLAGGLLLEAFGFRPMILSSSALLLAAMGLIAFLVPAPVETPGAGPRPGVRQNVRLVLDAPFLSAASLIQFLVQMSFMAMHPVMVLFVREIAPGSGRDAGMTGLVFGVTAASTLVGAAFWGRRSDRRGAASVLTVSLGACALLYIPQILSTDYRAFLAWRAALGFFIGGIQPSLHSLILKSVPADRRAGILGVTFSASLLGNAIGPVLGGLAAGHGGARAPFLFTGLALGACWFLARRAFRPAAHSTTIAP